MSSSALDKNSEILFIYDARLCNPNGDPDRENKPRIDPITLRNYVTDVRLKRFFRDYIIGRVGERYVWVTKIDGRNVTADKRLERSKEDWKYEKPLDASKYHIDARLFGATIPIKGEGRNGSGESYQLIGPVQFAMGYSLHKVDIVSEASTITSRFVGAEKVRETQYGTIGKDWRVYYSLIAFYGVVNAARAESTGMREDDAKLLDNFLWEAVQKESVTRSKIGHYPHLYLRVQYKDGETLLGDLRRFIDEDFKADDVRGLENLSIKFDRLVETVKDEKQNIDKIFIRESEEFATRFQIVEKLNQSQVELVSLPHTNINLNENTLIISP
jgi:CRISPR-associated protein Csh2